LLCNGTAANCSACTNTTAKTYYLSASSLTCLLVCPAGQFINTLFNNTCSYCAIGCAICSSSSNYCTSCTNDGTTPYYKSVKTASCALTCPDGQYINTALVNSCSMCNSECLLCSFTPNNCTSCTTSNNQIYYKSATTNTCVLSCPNG
jgi:hypothetical protein